MIILLKKHQTIERIINTGIVAVVRSESIEEGVRISTACVEGGIPAIEVTYTVPGATDVIKALKKEFSEDELIVGAGTVLDAATARIICSSKPGPVSKPDDNKRHQPHYLSSHSSSFRVTTKALSNVSAKAKIDMKPAGNPILIALLSLTTLFAIKFKKD